MPDLAECRPILLGVRGTELSAEDKAAIACLKPMGVILFARNIESVEQTQNLCRELSALLPKVGRRTPKALIAVDQEGGRVQRLTFNGRRPPARVFGVWAEQNKAQALRAAELNHYLLTADMQQVGANWMMGPLVDILLPETHGIIGNRAFDANPELVTELADACLAGVVNAGGVPCLKHAPGHGRAVADSHVELPVVTALWDELEALDWVPYKKLAKKSAFIMTAHVAFPEIQKKNDVPATYDHELLLKLRSEWDFDGIWLSDDVGMQALNGGYVERIERSLAGGCGVVICSLSTLVHGMAGTVFDEKSWLEMMDGMEQIPLLDEASLRVLGGLEMTTFAGPDEVIATQAEFDALWKEKGADVAALIGYTLPL